jgi:hypothetical protein
MRIGIAPSDLFLLPQSNAGSSDDRMAAASGLSLKVPVIKVQDA